VNLDDLEWNRPDSHCEPQQAGDILRNLQPDETRFSVTVRWIGRRDAVGAVVAADVLVVA
jgi:hypothetical protein